MGWKSALVESPAKLNLSNNQLVLTGQDQSGQVPVEDLTSLIIDNPQVTITAALLSHMALEGCPVIICDKKHMPCGLYLPFHQHTRQAKVAALQLDAGGPLRKRLWQGLVRQKITNQAMALDICGRDGGRKLRLMRAQTDSGDTRNMEAQAARLYWQYLMGSEFVRQGYRDDSPDRLNGALNYGYAIMRSVVCKALVSRGLLPALGVKHDNNLNAFNLADDFIEPLRPLVECQVWRLKERWPLEQLPLSREDRQELALLTHHKIEIAGQVVSAHHGAEMMASSLVRALERKEAGLLVLPELVSDNGLADERE
jgi:CRISPR-associated protein Cas1